MAPLDLPVEHGLGDGGENNNHINGGINDHMDQEEEQQRFNRWASSYVAHIIYWFQNGPVWIREDAARRLGLVSAQNPRMRELHEVRQFHVFRNGVIAPEFWEPFEIVNGHNPADDNPGQVRHRNGEQ